MNVLYWLLFAFVAIGAKLILAFITIFLLLPSDRRCTQCDGATLLMRMGRSGRMASRLTLGTLQWRWCPRCGWEGIARTGRAPYHPTRETGFPHPPRRADKRPG